jgi:hypothetical protein
MERLQLIQAIELLEYKAKVYAEFWGPGSAEVVMIGYEISELKFKLLDLMIEN